MALGWNRYRCGLHLVVDVAVVDIPPWFRQVDVDQDEELEDAAVAVDHRHYRHHYHDDPWMMHESDNDFVSVSWWHLDGSTSPCQHHHCHWHQSRDRDRDRDRGPPPSHHLVLHAAAA